MTAVSETPTLSEQARILADEMTSTLVIAHDGFSLYPAQWDSRIYHAQIRVNAEAVFEWLTQDHERFADPSLFNADRFQEVGRRFGTVIGGDFANFVGPQQRVIGSWACQTLAARAYEIRYPIGSRWTVNTHDSRFSGLRVGQEVVVLPYYAHPNGLNFGDGDTEVYVNDNLNAEQARVFVSPSHLSPLHSTVEENLPSTEAEPPMVPETVARSEHDSVVAERDEARAEAARLRTQIATLRTTWQNEMEALGNRLMEEADRRDWCSEYDEIVDKVNQSLTYELPVRESEIEVTWTETYTVTVTRSGTTMSRRGDEDDAASAYAEDCGELEEYELIELLRSNGNHSFDDAGSPDWTHS